MVKKVVQQGRSERRGDAYFVPYVEPLSDARTKLADFFTILSHLTQVAGLQRLVRNDLVKRHLHTPLPLPIFQ